MSNGGGTQVLDARPNGAGNNGNGNGNKQNEEDTPFRDKLVERWKATADEAGRPEGRVVPALVLGEQRYPDPTVWGPKTDTPLMQDEDYREALAFLSRLEEPSEPNK